MYKKLIPIKNMLYTIIQPQNSVFKHYILCWSYVSICLNIANN